MSELFDATQMLKTATPALKLETPALKLNEGVKCPHCESRNLMLFINKKIADVIHFNDGVLDFKQHNALNLFHSITFECKDCESRFTDETVKNLDQIFL